MSKKISYLKKHLTKLKVEKLIYSKNKRQNTFSEALNSILTTELTQFEPENLLSVTSNYLYYSILYDIFRNLDDETQSSSAIYQLNEIIKNPLYKDFPDLVLPILVKQLSYNYHSNTKKSFYPALKIVKNLLNKHPDLSIKYQF